MRSNGPSRRVNPVPAPAHGTHSAHHAEHDARQQRRATKQRRASHHRQQFGMGMLSSHEPTEDVMREEE